MTIHWKAVEQYFTVVLFVFQFSVCNFGKFNNFGLDTVRSERVNDSNGQHILRTNDANKDDVI